MALPKVAAGAAAVPLGIGKAGLDAITGPLKNAASALDPRNLTKAMMGNPIISSVNSGIKDMYEKLSDAEANNDAIKESSTKTANSVGDLVSLIKEQNITLEKILELQQDQMTKAARQRVMDEEARREANRVKSMPEPTSGAGVTDKETPGLLSVIANRTIGLAAIGGTLALLSTTFQNISTTVAGVEIVKNWDSIKANFLKVFGSEGKIVNFFKFLTPEVVGSYFDKAKAGITERLSKIGDIFKPITDFVDDFKKGFVQSGGMDTLTRIKNFFGETFGKIGGYIDDIMKGPVGTVMGKLGPIFKKLFLPIGAVITAYDTVKGAIEGFEEGGWVNGIMGAVGGFFGSVIGGLADLIKSAVSWVVGKLGFKNFEKQLDSFKFEDLIKNFFQGLANLFKTVVNGIIEGIAKGVSWVSDAAAEKIRSYKFEIEENEAPNGVDMDDPEVKKLREQIWGENKLKDAKARKEALQEYKRLINQKKAEAEKEKDQNSRTVDVTSDEAFAKEQDKFNKTFAPDEYEKAQPATPVPQQKKDLSYVEYMAKQIAKDYQNPIYWRDAATRASITGNGNFDQATFDGIMAILEKDRDAAVARRTEKLQQQQSAADNAKAKSGQSGGGSNINSAVDNSVRSNTTNIQGRPQATPNGSRMPAEESLYDIGGA